MDRRTVIKHGAALALTTAMPASEALAQTVLLRRAVSTMAPNDPILNSYRAAVAAMKQLDVTSPNDPRGWTKQAQIHLNFCPHNNWFFLPWHRAYLVAFERICRQLSGNSTFALPYWDWTANPQLPATFANPAGAANPLFNSTRSSQTVTMPTNNTGTTVINNILAETNFEVFGSSRPPAQNNTNPTWQRNQTGTVTGQFEGNPHNSVHGRISGNMGTFLSPLDPIFWLHHCNIDRIWDRWNRMGRVNTSDTRWRDFAFNNQFVVPSGAGSAPFNVAVNGLLNINTLGYRYVLPSVLVAATHLNLIPRQLDLNRLPQLARLENVGAARLNTPLDMPVKLNSAQNIALERIRPTAQLMTESASKAVEAPGRIVAIIRDIEPPKNNSVEVRVFVNCPYLSPDTPPEDRHYAGSFGFFGGEHTEHASKPSYLIDLTNTVITLRQLQPEIKDQITVQLMPVPIPGGPKEGNEFKPGQVEIAII